MLRDEIEPYLDGQGYVAPNLVPPGTIRSSDNQTMFTGEYYIILQRLGQGNDYDWMHWRQLIAACEKEPGLTVRSPGDTALDSPDNTLGILSAATVLGDTGVPQEILTYGYKHFGFFNPTGKFTWEAFLWRQPQLYTACLAAANKLRFYHLPFTLYTALVILFAAIVRPPVSQADPRRLSWHLIQIMKPKSLMCRLAAHFWYMGLYKDYPGELLGFSTVRRGMQGVAAQYYEAGHPFIRYWKD